MEAIAHNNLARFNRVIAPCLSAEDTVTLEALRPFQKAGLPVLDVLAEELHLTIEQVQHLDQQGISGKDAIEAIWRGLNERFGPGLGLTLEAADVVLRHDQEQRAGANDE